MIAIYEKAVVNLNLTIEEYVVCYCLTKRLKLIGLRRDFNLDQCINKLVESGLLFKVSDAFYPSKKFIEAIEIDDDNAFDEFWLAFPTTAEDGRKLKSALKESVKKKYYEVIGSNPAKHEKILKCLAIEIEQRKERSQLMYMRNIMTWLNNEVWKQYEEDLIKESKIKEDVKKENRLF